MGPLRNANATRLWASAANSGSNVIFRLGIGVSQTRNHTQTNGRQANRQCSQRGVASLAQCLYLHPSQLDRVPFRQLLMSSDRQNCPRRRPVLGAVSHLHMTGPLPAASLRAVFVTMCLFP